MGSGKFVKVNENEFEGTNRRGISLGRWKDRVKECLGERGRNGRGVLEEARRECRDRERWTLFCHSHLLGDTPGGSEASELLID